MGFYVSRRSFLRAGGLLLAGSLIDPALGWGVGHSSVIRRRTLWSMGGWNYLEVEAENDTLAHEALQLAADAIRHVDQTYSVFDDRSILSRINHSSETTVPVDDPAVIVSIRRSLDLAAVTDGAFDPTVEALMAAFGYRDQANSRIGSLNATSDFRLINCDHNRGVIQRDHRRLALDSGGWAKGLAADEAVAAALEAGVQSAQVNCGFDIVRHGKGAWECLIRHPRRSLRDVAVRCRHNYRAVATSANTETWRAGSNGRSYGHLMDPRTDAPAQSDLESVTVFAGDGFTADALASALFVMGQDEAIRWLRSRPDVGAVLIPTEWNDEIGTLRVFGRIEADKVV